MALAQQDTWSNDLAAPNASAIADIDRDRPKNLTPEELVFWHTVS